MLPKHKREQVGDFIKELNLRELAVRFNGTHTFDSWTSPDRFGFGFKVDGLGVPYFHPNRSFHDEVIWLNNNLYYNEDVPFEDRLINSCIVKFYGPSQTLNILTRGLEKNWVEYDKFMNDDEYVLKLQENLHNAVNKGEKIFGTTELRTSLQTAARNFSRLIETPFDKKYGTWNAFRKGRCCDILYWFQKLGPKMVSFYKTKPYMEESFNFLNSFRGIGNYYGYHLSSNLARMPELGNLLIGDAPTGNLNEDDDFVAVGVGAMKTINWFFEDEGFSVNDLVGRRIVNAIRRDQQKWYNMNDTDYSVHSKVSELGEYTNFGVEISLCQFSVFLRLQNNRKLALKRADAPISKELGCDPVENKQFKLF